ncbi:uncharacterized protein SCHCODRAFT_02044718 [Schizophyllum commune H4-8]|uniref:uncharacterized protein n=1 Tax=Schizophyllum commune (strain H4-8 / FGSC 9210) TaxID=578458 RepID=UPI0021600611|nr:uncharacterized protein SCHCODRAFT_02044718 [Schizophyllum commune H4-8]KAI5900822.1 hypothetical protein SCHCODRAFT_02044718 [Schizophyllum commune H4-8]
MLCTGKELIDIRCNLPIQAGHKLDVASRMGSRFFRSRRLLTPQRPQSPQCPHLRRTSPPQIDHYASQRPLPRFESSGPLIHQPSSILGTSTLAQASRFDAAQDGASVRPRDRPGSHLPAKRDVLERPASPPSCSPTPLAWFHFAHTTRG